MDRRPVVSRAGRGDVVAAPPVAAAGSDRPSDEFVNLNFKVPPSVRKRFRLLAVNEDLKNVELLVHLLDRYERETAAAS